MFAAIAALLVVSASAVPQPGPVLRTDPALLLLAHEAWRFTARPDNPIWPGWDASATPLLFYLPGEQDVLVNHPTPPAGFAPLGGPMGGLFRSVLVKDGPTLIAFDGQNTAMEIAGVQTLVVADTLSTRRQQVEAWMNDPRPAAEVLGSLVYQGLLTDPMGQMQMIVHEAFHVHQARLAPDKAEDNRALRNYPTLSVENNLGMVAEAEALEEALRAPDEAGARAGLARWLAVRDWRRGHLPEDCSAYEDGVEFSEGVAHYAEWALLDALSGAEPGAPLWALQGFTGYADLATRRDALLRRMRDSMTGAMVVNNDEFGMSPVRFRLYSSGMALCAALDRVAPGWKARAFEPGLWLTDLARAAVGGEARKIDVTALLASERYRAAREAKQDLARRGAEHVARLVADITDGPETALVFDLSRAPEMKMGLSYTPFGVQRVDDDRVVYSLVPVAAESPDGPGFALSRVAPVLHDRRARTFTFPLAALLHAPDLLAALGRDALPEGAIEIDQLELPGATVSSLKGEVRLDAASNTLRIAVLP